MSIENVNLQHKRLSDADFASTTPLDGQFILRSSDMTLKTGVGNQCAFINLKTLQNVCQIGNDMCWMGNTVYHSGNDGASSNLDAGLFCNVDFCTIDNRYIKKTQQGIGSGLDADLLDGVQSNINKVANTIPIRNASGCMIGDISGNANTLSNCTLAGIFTYVDCSILVSNLIGCSVAGYYDINSRGTIQQWGDCSVVADGTGGTNNVTITLPYAMPNAAYNVQLTLEQSVSVAGNISPYFNTRTLQTFKIGLDTDSTSGTFNVSWRVIGR